MFYLPIYLHYCVNRIDIMIYAMFKNLYMRINNFIMHSIGYCSFMKIQVRKNQTYPFNNSEFKRSTSLSKTAILMSCHDSNAVYITLVVR